MSLKNSQRELLEETSQYEERILDLRTRQNTFSHISMLPPELLLRIFKISMFPGLVKLWHRITHVCRHWRWIAVGAPMLWTSPPTHLKDYTLLMLKRSMDAPLKIEIGHRTSELATAATFGHLRRIRVLKIHQSDEQLFQTQEILHASTQVASALVSLEVWNTGDSDDTLALPSYPFRQSRFLRHLELFFVSIDWNIFPLPNLAYLSLRMASTTSISLEQILSALSGTPNLERLFLELNLDVVEDDSTTPNIVCLHHLRTLSLPDFDAFQLCRLMSSLRLPSLTNLGADIDLVAANIDGYQGVLSQISSVVDDANFPTLDLLHLSAFSGECRLAPRHGRLSNRHSVTIQLPSATDARNDHHNIVRRFINGMPLVARHNFEVLTHIYIDAHLGSKRLVQLFGSLPNLMAMMIIPGRTVVALIRALKATNQNSGQTTMAFPKLLCIGWCAFKWERYGRNKLLGLCDTLTHRYNYGAGIKRLYLSHCSKIPDDIVEALEKIGVSFHIHSDLYSNHDGWIVDESMASTTLDMSI